MAHALDDLALTVFLEEIIALDDAMDVMTLILTERGEMLRRAAEEMHGQRQPARVERYLEHTIPLYNVQEFKSLLRPAFCIHYAQVSRLCSYTCDKFSAACDLVARLRLGYRYYWEVGGAPPVPCALCARPGGHMLQHCVLHCSVISDYRP